RRRASKGFVPSMVGFLDSRFRGNDASFSLRTSDLSPTTDPSLRLGKHHLKIFPVFLIRARTRLGPFGRRLKAVRHLRRPPAHIGAAQQIGFHRRAHTARTTPHVRLPTGIEHRRAAARHSHTNNILFYSLSLLNEFRLLIRRLEVFHSVLPFHLLT